MAGFSKDINLNPADIPRMPLEQKQECMTEIEKVRSRAWKFTVFFCLGLIAFFMIYSLICTMYTLRELDLLPSVSPVMILLPVIVFIPALAAHSMNKAAVIFTILAYMGAGLLSVYTGELINGWAAVPCVAGAVMYFWLYTVCDSYKALEKEEGFPDFFDIRVQSALAKDIIERNKEEKPALNPLTEFAIENERNRREKEAAEAVKASAEEKPSEDIKTEEKPSEESVSEEVKAEETLSEEKAPDTAPKPNPNKKKRSNKKKRRK